MGAKLYCSASTFTSIILFLQQQQQQQQLTYYLLVHATSMVSDECIGPYPGLYLSTDAARMVRPVSHHIDDSYTSIHLYSVIGQYLQGEGDREDVS